MTSAGDDLRGPVARPMVKLPLEAVPSIVLGWSGSCLHSRVRHGVKDAYDSAYDSAYEDALRSEDEE